MDRVSSFTFKLTFNREVYLSSGWNGAVEIHQLVQGGELVSTVPDLRVFNPADYSLETVNVDGENLIVFTAGDYLIYYPSTSANALEVPINPGEGTTPGFILYVPNGQDISDSVLDIQYSLYRQLISEPLFWLSAAGLLIWIIGLITFAITTAKLKEYRERHERDNKIINESIETFTGFIDAKDPYTNGHSKRVAQYTRSIAREMGYEGEELDRIYYIALLHDCGKIGVPDSILRKPGKLTDEEFEIIKSHTVRGAEILSSFKSLKDVGEGAHYHHERYDGKGYPEGKKGEEIPLIARMICVADSFDAMNSNRVYRKKLTKEYILYEIERNKGLQFDPKIADIMLRLLREGKIDMDFDEAAK
ncbi:MAG: HD-GYP domain-containing protein [Oscillospiraceae bacterium]|nr:HD-GYP domain-containing protein [Oscillospiraceae bacterium]